MYRKLHSFFLLALLFTSPPLAAASTALIKSDYNGCPGCLVTDDTTKLQWLNPLYTAGVSYNQIDNGWGNLTSTEGFSIATGDQMHQLYAALDVSPTDAWVSVVRGNADNFFAIFSPVSEYGGFQRYRSVSGYIDSSTTTTAYIAHMDQDRNGEQSGGDYLSYIHHDPYSYDKNHGASSKGTWLVRPVPEPSTLSMLAAGIALAAALSRPKSRGKIRGR